MLESNPPETHNVSRGIGRNATLFCSAADRTCCINVTIMCVTEHIWVLLIQKDSTWVLLIIRAQSQVPCIKKTPSIELCRLHLPQSVHLRVAAFNSKSTDNEAGWLRNETYALHAACRLSRITARAVDSVDLTDRTVACHALHVAGHDHTESCGAPATRL